MFSSGLVANSLPLPALPMQRRSGVVVTESGTLCGPYGKHDKDIVGVSFRFLFNWKQDLQKNEIA